MCPAWGDHLKKKKCIESKTKWFSHSNIFDIKKLPAGTGPQGTGNVTGPTRTCRTDVCGFRKHPEDPGRGQSFNPMNQMVVGRGRRRWRIRRALATFLKEKPGG